MTLLLFPQKYMLDTQHESVLFTIFGAKSCWATLVDHSRLIDYFVSKSRVQKYGRDHDR